MVPLPKLIDLRQEAETQGGTEMSWCWMTPCIGTFIMLYKQYLLEDHLSSTWCRFCISLLFIQLPWIWNCEIAHKVRPALARNQRIYGASREKHGKRKSELQLSGGNIPSKAHAKRKQSKYRSGNRLLSTDPFSGRAPQKLWLSYACAVESDESLPRAKRDRTFNPVLTPPMLPCFCEHLL